MDSQGRNSSSRSSSSSRLSAFNVPPFDSTLIRYLHSRTPAIGGGFGSPVPSRSPLTSIENFYTPPSRSPTAFKVEEDVVVMDGILVGSEPRGKARSSKGSSSSGRGRSSVVSDTGGSSSTGSVTWQRDDSPRLKVAHEKEQLHASRFPNKKKSEAKICTFTSSGSCSHGVKCPFVHHHALESESPTYVMERPTVPTVSPMKLENLSKIYSSINSFTLTGSDWCPLDDGIDIYLPPPASTDEIPSREAVNAYIDGVLYGHSRRKRLSIFTEICPE